MKTFAKLRARTQKPSARVQNAARQTKWELRNILVPTDFSEPSKKALNYALCLAKQNGAKITLLHVLSRFLFIRTPFTQS